MIALATITRATRWAEQLHQLAEQAGNRHEWLGQIAIDEALLSDVDLAKILARELDLPCLDLRDVTPDVRALALANAQFCRQHRFVPLRLTDDAWHVAVADPLDGLLLDSLREVAPQARLQLAVAPMTQVLAAVETWYGTLEIPPAPEPVLAPPPQAPARPAIYRHTSLAQKTDAGLVPIPYPHALVDLLLQMVEENASDLHLTAGTPPRMRIDGRLEPMALPVLQPGHILWLVGSILDDRQQADFAEALELDFAFGLGDLARFRTNIFQQRGSACAVFRSIPREIPALDTLGLPKVLHEFCALEHGLVLVTGPTGSGKTTTLAAMIAEMNRTRHAHIITLEDPIEYIYNHGTCTINQREIGRDSRSFVEALKRALRQDPDILLLGEMRDLETIAAAMTAAETGHLVLATLHTASAEQTIDRIIDVFPPEQQAQIRAQLAAVLRATVTQTLIPRATGKGRVCAQEICVATPAVRTLIRECKTHQLSSLLESGAQYGMQTMEKALGELAKRGLITHDDAKQRHIDAHLMPGRPDTRALPRPPR